MNRTFSINGLLCPPRRRGSCRRCCRRCSQLGQLSQRRQRAIRKACPGKGRRGSEPEDGLPSQRGERSARSGTALRATVTLCHDTSPVLSEYRIGDCGPGRVRWGLRPWAGTARGSLCDHFSSSEARWLPLPSSRPEPLSRCARAGCQRVRSAWLVAVHHGTLADQPPCQALFLH